MSESTIAASLWLKRTHSKPAVYGRILDDIIALLMNVCEQSAAISLSIFKINFNSINARKKYLEIVRNLSKTAFPRGQN
jgi:hypothetical protein